LAVTVNQAALAGLLTARTGPVERNMRLRAELVALRATELIQQDLRARSGSLLRSVSVDEHPTGGYRVFCNPDIAPYAGFLEHGTAPHPITPRNARVLVSEADNPDPLRSPQRAVSHPGNQPYGFMVGALAAARF
jgi:hypothetical protein